MMCPRVLFCCILCLFQCCQLVSSSNCNPENLYPKFGKCCQKCSPGMHVSSECTEGKDTECQHCGPDRYQSQWNTLQHCQMHKICTSNGGFVVEKVGTSTSDAVCRCQVGKHCVNKDCEICDENRVCQPGYGVVHRAESGNFTIPVCQMCEGGYYSNVSSNMEPCRRWSDCGSLQVLVNGTTTKDVECGTPEPPSKVVLVVVIVFLSAVLTAILLSFVVYSAHNQENRTKIRGTITRLVKCSSKVQFPTQELTENGNILTTAGEEDKSPDVMTELLPV